MDMTILKKKDGENERQYVWRLASAKDSGLVDLTWPELTDIFNKELRDEETGYTEAAYRKQYQYAKAYYDDVFSLLIDDEYCNDIKEQRRELEKEKVKFRDERNGYKKLLRDKARNEADLHNLITTIGGISQERYPRIRPCEYNESENELLVILSDLHIGACFDNSFGSYSVEIARERLSKYLAEIKELHTTYSASKCHVSISGDILSGAIHKSLQIENRENINEQITKSTILVSDFLYELGTIFSYVEVVSVPGNHSRLDKKDDAVHAERLDSLIPWIISLNLKSCSNIEFKLDNTIDDGISSLDICGKEYINVHGDFDAFSEAGVAKLVMILGHIPYCITFAHKHTPAMKDVSGVKIVQAGALPGTGDQFTVEKRLKGDPSQTVLVCNKKGIKAHCPIWL